MELTKRQRRVIKRAATMLLQYDKEDVSHQTYYFQEQDENGNCLNDLVENDCCDNEACVDKTMDELRAEYKNVDFIRYNNDGDHEKIERCYQCFRPLNEQLTWIADEFYHHFRWSITKKELVHSSVAFEVRCMLEALPSNDRYLDIKKVVAYAHLVINALKN